MSETHTIQRVMVFDHSGLALQVQDSHVTRSKKQCSGTMTDRLQMYNLPAIPVTDR